MEKVFDFIVGTFTTYTVYTRSVKPQGPGWSGRCHESTSLFIFLLEVLWMLTNVLDYGSRYAETGKILIRFTRVSEGVTGFHLLNQPLIHEEDAESVEADEEEDIEDNEYRRG